MSARMPSRGFDSLPTDGGFSLLLWFVMCLPQKWNGHPKVDRCPLSPAYSLLFLCSEQGKMWAGISLSDKKHNTGRIWQIICKRLLQMPYFSTNWSCPSFCDCSLSWEPEKCWFKFFWKPSNYQTSLLFSYFLPSASLFYLCCCDIQSSIHFFFWICL